jgi:plastocyanin
MNIRVSVVRLAAGAFALAACSSRDAGTGGTTTGAASPPVASAPAPATDSTGRVAAPPSATTGAGGPAGATPGPAGSGAATPATPANPGAASKPGTPTRAPLGPTPEIPVVAPTLSVVDTTILIGADGPELAFNPATIVVRAGTRVRIRFKNAGTLAHNFILVRNEDDIDDLAREAADLGGEHVPMMSKSKLLVFTNMASAGQTVEAGFVVPPAGTYFYVCMVEGHVNTMVGKLISLR